MTIREIDLAGDVRGVARALGATTDALLTCAQVALLFDLGANAVDPRLLGALSKWLKKNEPLLRARAGAMVFVVPGCWHAWQWRLAMLLERDVVPSKVTRSRDRATAWLAVTTSARARGEHD